VSNGILRSRYCAFLDRSRFPIETLHLFFYNTICDLLAASALAILDLVLKPNRGQYSIDTTHISESL
jgi:hypothetical protein